MSREEANVSSGIRICHICSYYNNVLFHTLVSAQKAFSEPTVFFFKPVHTETQYDLPGIDEVNCFTQADRFLFFRKERKVYDAYERLYGDRTFDLNYAHSLFANGYIAYRAYKERGIPYVVMVQNTDINVFFKYRLPLRSTGVKIALNAERIVFASESYKNRFVSRYVPREHRAAILSKAMVIPYSIDDLFYDDPAPVKTAPHDPCRVLSAGLVCENKNQLAVCRAVERLRAEGMDLRLTVIGKVQDQRIADELSKRPFVTLEPFVEKEVLKEKYRSHDLFALASKTETFGLVYAEALSQGLPILYSRGEGFDGQFPEGQVGFAADPLDTADIAEGLRRILAAYPALAKNAVPAADRFRMSLVAERYRAMYDEVLRGRKA